jgi:hypothetical protein
MTKLRVSDDRTHHVYEDGTPAYEERYDFVLDFCNGFAVVVDDSGFFILIMTESLFMQRNILRLVVL